MHKKLFSYNKSIVKSNYINKSGAFMKEYVKGANPYMPLWEHVPDGEPRVFEFNGEKRVYVYGSHDTMKTEYCGKDQVCWSAPVDDLTNWKCHGICYTATDNSVLYAPDVVQKGDTFYLFAAEGCGSRIMVATSKNPAGPFINPVKTDLGFDPGILVDDDGRVYAYWGFCHSYCAELNDDMATIKDGTFRDAPLGNCFNPWKEVQDSTMDSSVGFFEASSPRKIMGKYVYIYSKRYDYPVPELGVTGECNGFLSYKVSDNPLEGFTDGGDISFNGGEILYLDDKNPSQGTMTYRWGNNHGSLMEINGKWYIFYHRHTDTNEYCRQAMVEPVEIAMDKNGKIYIGKITYENNQPVKSSVVEMTSQGFNLDGLDARKWISAGYACHLYGGKETAIIKAVYDKTDEVTAPVVNITNNLTAGFKYLQFGNLSPKSVTVQINVLENTIVNVRTDNYKGNIIASFDLKKGTTQATANLNCEIQGKHGIYFEFITKSEKPCAEFLRFTFD